jgi:hypothetical protein
MKILEPSRMRCNISFFGIGVDLKRLQQQLCLKYRIEDYRYSLLLSKEERTVFMVGHSASYLFSPFIISILLKRSPIVDWSQIQSGPLSGPEYPKIGPQKGHNYSAF